MYGRNLYSYPHDNGVPDYEISNFLEISIKHVEDVLSDY